MQSFEQTPLFENQHVNIFKTFLLNAYLSPFNACVNDSVTIQISYPFHDVLRLSSAFRKSIMMHIVKDS